MHVANRTIPLRFQNRISGPATGLACLQGTSEAELRRDAVDTVGGVEVLDDNNLEAGGGALARGNSGISEEELPNLDSVSWMQEHLKTTYPEPSRPVSSNNLVSVTEPVAVPPPKGSRVVNTNSINAGKIVS